MKSGKQFILSTFFVLIALATATLLTAGKHHTKQYLNDFLQDLLQKVQVFAEGVPEDKVYLQFDRPFYKPGETIWFTAYVREGMNMKPSKKSDMVNVDFIGPKGNIIKTHKIITTNGVAKGDFALGANDAGGMYKVKAYTEWQKNDPDPAFFEKDVQVQAVILPRLKMKLDFEREAYGPGDDVTAELKLNTNTNKPLNGHDFNFVVSVDGNELLKSKASTTASGEANINFKLPNRIKNPDGLLNVMIQYQGMTESISRSLPIVLNNVKITLYPEGGDLVEGLPGRVAFRALNEFDKPADVEGVVEDSEGNDVAIFASYHMGMGAFDIQPKAGETYTLKITRPVGVTETFEIPEALPRGYGMKVNKVGKEAIRMNIHSSETEELSLVAMVRGKSYFSTSIKAQKGTNEISIPTNRFPIGVTQVTLFDSKGIERAERLAFVNKDKQLNIKVSTDKEKYLPREEVNMTIEVTDERGMPMPADLSVSVADDQLLSFADDKSSNILSWLLMESDIKGEVEEPNFYFDPKEEKADLALDYLMMTAGWRRFSWQEILKDDLPPLANAGERTVIAGKVINSDDGKPVPYANIEVLGSGQAARAGFDGSFEINMSEFVGPKRLRVGFSNWPAEEYSVNAFTQDLELRISSDPYITGTVREAETGEPLPGATVVVKNTNTGALTDMDGRFKLRLPSSTSGEKLVVSYIGMEQQEIDLSGRRSINVDMESSAIMLEEVVVMAAPRRELRGVASSVQGQAPGRSRGGRKKGKTARAQMARPIGGIVDAAPAAAVPAEIDRPMEVEAQNAPEPMPMQQDDFVGDAGEVAFDDKADDEMDFDGLVFAEEALEDNRANGFANKDVMEKEQKLPLQQAQQVVYYRAREFAAPVYERPTEVKVRNDFRSTIYWNGHVEIGRNGKTTLTFHNSDDISSFRIIAEGIAADGMIGRVEKNYYTQLPFSMAAKIPAQVVMEDLLHIPLTLVNNTSTAISGELELSFPQGMKPVSELPKNINLEPNKAETIYLKFKVDACTGVEDFSATFRSWGFADAIEQPVTILSKGFPVSLAYSGTETETTYGIDLHDVIDGSLDISLIAYPSTVSELMSGLESMLREPHGCFEQTSSSTYPNILVLRYLEETDQANSAVTSKARNLIAKGYQRLTSFESKNGGFEWFGGDPAHEGLTAYGVLEFTDMQAVYNGVDQKMLDRTADWLMSRRDGNGGFKRNPRALHQFGLADQETMNAYIVYALTEAGYSGLNRELIASYDIAMKTKNPYQLGLVANALYNYKEESKAGKALAELLSVQANEGNWSTDGRSAPGSGGQSLIIETTSLAMLAMMKGNSYDRQSLGKAAEFLRKSRSGYGGFGATNSTVLALRALTKYAAFSKRADEDGTIEIYVDGNKIATKEYEKGMQDPVTISGLGELIPQGKHRLMVKYVGVKQALPYSIAVNYNTALPNSSKDCVVRLKTDLDKKKMKVGETVRLTTELRNTTDEGQPMTIAIVGLPAGLSAQPWQLKELQEKAQVDFYEIIGNNLVLYYRQMKPSEKRIINFDLKAEVPGQFDAPASSAYLYYTNEHKDWTSAEQIRIEN